MVEALSVEVSERALQFSVLSRPWLAMATAMANISTCFLFLKFVRKQRPWNIFLAIKIFLLFIINLLPTLTTHLQCRPLEKLWIPTTDGTCWDPLVQQNIGYAQGVFAIFTDFFLAFFSTMIIKSMTSSKKMPWSFCVLAGLSLV